MGLSGSTYAVVFGHVLDGLLWDRLALTGAVPETRLSDAHPWWNGAFWAVYPPREGAAGTNFVDCDNATLVQVWTTATIARLDALAASEALPDTIRGLLDPAGTAAAGEVVDAAGVRWPLRRPDGRPAIPIVGVNGPLDHLGTQVANVVAEAIVGTDTDTDTAAARAMVPCDDAKTQCYSG
jgi:hypothetical protein